MKDKINQLKAGVLLSYLSMGASTLISIIYTPVMLRLLGQSEYGLYQLAYTVVSYLGLLSFGFGSAFMRFYSRYKARDDQRGMARLNGMFLTIFSIIGIISLIAGGFLIANVGAIFKGGLTDGEIVKARILMILMVFNVAVSFPASVFDSNVTAREQYFFQRAVSLLRSVFNPLLTLPLLLLGFKSIGLVVVTTVLTIASLAVNIWYCLKRLKIKFSFRGFDKSLMGEIWVFSFFIFLNMITDQINWSVDKFILGKFAGTIGVAVYSVGAQLNTYYMSFSTSISSVFIPRINRMVAQAEDDWKLTELFTRVGRVQFLILSYILGGLVILGQYFIPVWAGEGYDISYQITLLLIIPVTIPLIQNLGIEIQRAKNMHKFRSIVYILIAVANIFISIPLCRAYGAGGAAVGTALSLIVGNGILMNWYYHNKVGLDILFFWRQIIKLFPAVLAATAVGMAIKLTVGINSIGMFLIAGIIYTAAFITCIWFFGMNAYEKELFSSPMKKLAGQWKKGA